MVEYGVESAWALGAVVAALINRRVTVHAVVALDLTNDRLFMVTVYRPVQEKWQDDWRNRK